MRKIICLRAEEAGGNERPYQVGAGIGLDAGNGGIVQQIEVWRTKAGITTGATITCADGTTREIPERRIISWDLSPEESH